jgi:hypothetical protein
VDHRAPPVAHSPLAVESLARCYEMWRPHLTERRRRVWLGAEARELRAGGPVVVAQAVGMALDTVRRVARSSTIRCCRRWGVSHAGRDARRRGLGIRELAARHGVHRRTIRYRQPAVADTGTFAGLRWTRAVSPASNAPGWVAASPRCAASGGHEQQRGSVR